MNRFLVEACVNSVQSALEAQAGGASRVELCDNLLEGGTTPSPGAVAAARKHLDIDLNVMIRPRGADFLYSELELEIMRADVLRAGDLGADGIVIGILQPDGTIDAEETARIVELAGPMSVTFHRAFDMTVNPIAALETLVSLRVDRVLTSGQRPSAMEGAGLLAELVEKAGGRIVIMPGVGIDQTNIARLIGATGASEYHVLAQKRVPSRMEYRNDRLFMGADDRLPEYETLLTDRDRIREICVAASAVQE